MENTVESGGKKKSLVREKRILLLQSGSRIRKEKEKKCFAEEENE